MTNTERLVEAIHEISKVHVEDVRKIVERVGDIMGFIATDPADVREIANEHGYFGETAEQFEAVANIVQATANFIDEEYGT